MKGILNAFLVFLFFSGCAYEVAQKPTRQTSAASKKRQNAAKNKANLNSNKTNYNANLVYISRDMISQANAYTNEPQTRRQMPQKGRNLTLNNLNKIDKTAEQISQRERNLNSNQSEQTAQVQGGERIYQTNENLNLNEKIKTTRQILNLAKADEIGTQRERNLNLNDLNESEKMSQTARNLNLNQSEQTTQPQGSERVYQIEKNLNLNENIKTTRTNLNLKPSDTILAQRHFYLGVKFYSENDTQKARSQWAKSCEMGINEACYNLRCLENGYLQTGFKSLSNGACVQLTQIYAGLNYPKNDYQRARTYYEKGCDLGYGIACYLLAYLYDEGLSVPKSAQKARNYERKGFELMRKRD